MSADLHIYTDLSGGDWTVEKIFQYAKNRGLTTIAFTDRDRTENNQMGQIIQARFGIDFIPGIELCGMWRGKEVHVLGYFIKADNKYLEKHLKKVRDIKSAAAEKSVEKLRYFGLRVSFDELSQFPQERTTPGWPLLSLMVSKGYVRNIIEYYTKFFSYGKPGYVKIDYPELEEVLDIIDFAGGIPVLAHPGTLKVDSEVFKEIMSQKFKGIEAYSPYHTAEEIEFFKAYAQKSGLLALGGSESYGSLLSHKVGDVIVPAEEVEKLTKLKKVISPGF